MRSRLVLPVLVLIVIGIGSAIGYGKNLTHLLQLQPMPESDVTGSLRGGDFRFFWSEGYYVARGEAVRAYNRSDIVALPPMPPVNPGSHLSLYPPVWFLLVEPFGAMDFPTAWFVWMWGSVALYLAGVIMAFRREIYAVPLALGFGGFWLALDFGQNSVALAGLYLLVLACLPKREFPAGVLLGLAALKPHLGLPIPLWLFFRSHTMAILWAVLAIAALVAASWLRYGPEVWHVYLGEVYRPLKRLADFESVRPERMISLYASLRLWGAEAVTALVAQGVLALVALGMLIAVCRRAWDPQLPMAAAVVAGLLVTPHAYGYDLALLILPILVLVRRAQKRGWEIGDFEVFLPAYGLPFFTAYVNEATHLPVVPAYLLLFLYRLRQHSLQDRD